MKNLKKWLRNQATAIAISVSNIEKNSLTQEKKSVSDDIKRENKKTSYDLLNALKNNVVTQEVKDLRWRTYKVFQASKNLKVTNVNITDDDEGIHGLKAEYDLIKIDLSKPLKKIKIDTFDSYPLEMVVNNDEQTISSDLDTSLIKILDEPIVNKKDESTTIGEVKVDDLVNSLRPERQININRQYYPKIFIENFTKRVNIRIIDNDKRMIEFYISKYLDDNNPTSGILINQLKKIIQGNLTADKSNFINFDELEFITSNTIGAEDFLYYCYNNIVFDKIVEFDGNYVVKYIADIKTSGENLLEKYVEDALEEKYENKVSKKVTI
jgi:hypothetical protein